MAINFPDNPSNGDTYQGYTYNSTKNTWTPATSPAAVVEYATVDLLPGTADTGDMALVTATNRLYIWNGSGWYNIALINTTPSISGVNSSYVLASDGTATTITITATDPEGLPITYSIASDTSGNIATVTQGTGASSNVFTITPSTNTANAGTFSLTFRASDGVNIASSIASFELQFRVLNSNYTTALITTSGSTGTNSTFTDSSSNSHTVTAYGNVTQNSFSPYRSGGYSTYFDGSGDYLTVGDPFGFGTNDFTVEFWYNPSVQYSSSVHARLMGGETTASHGNTWSIIFTNYNGTNGMMFSAGVYGSYTGGRYVNGYWGTKGQWDHIVWQRNSGTIECYINGTSQTLTTMQQNTVWSDSTDIANIKNLTVGGDGSGLWYTGYMKELKITNGSALYTSGVTVPTEEISVGSADFLGLHLPYLKDSSSNDHSITPAGDVTAAGFGPYDYQEYAVGDHGGSVYLDGSGDYLTVANDASLKPTGNFTAEGWCYVDGTNASGSIFNMWTGSQGRMWALYVSSGGVTLSGNSNNIISHTVNNLNKWVHVAFTRDNSNALCTLYVNGKSVGTSTTTFSNSSAPLAIGFNLDGAPASYYYNGSITDLRISDTVRYTSDFTPPTEPFTTDSNTALLLSGQGAVILDKSQSVETLTLAGNTTASTTQYKYLPSSMYFDGTGDYLYLPNYTPQGTEDFTFEAWIYAQTASDSPIWESRPDGSNTTGFTVTAYSSTVIRVWVSSALLSATVSNYLNSWVHIAYTRSGSTNRLFINGSLEATATASDNFTNTDALIGGGRYTSGSNVTNYFNGYMSDLRITKGLARYTANFTPPTAALQG